MYLLRSKHLKSIVITLIALQTVGCSSVELPQVESMPGYSENDQTFFSTGEAFGSSRDEALEKALLNAVEKASGVFISQHLEINQGDLIKDRTIQYSAGYIRRFEIIEQVQTTDDAYYVSVNANISKSALLDFYSQSLDNDQLNIEGEQLYSAINHELNRRNSRLHTLEPLLESFPDGAIIPILVSQQARFSDKRELFFDTTWKIKWSQTFLDALYEHVNEVSDAKCELVSDPYGSWNANSVCGQVNFVGTGDAGFLDRLTGEYGESFVFDDLEYAKEFSRLITKDGNLAYNAIALVFEFVDNRDQVISEACVSISLGNYDQFMLYRDGYYSDNWFFNNVSVQGSTSIHMEDTTSVKNIIRLRPKIRIKC